MTRTQRLTGAVIGALFIALHLPFLPPTLEDLDSINFALGVRHYDISQHQPHPPGYPLYIGAAKLLHAAGLSEVHALSLLGVLAGGLALLACMRLFAALNDEQADTPFVPLAALVVAAAPLFWFTAARPLSAALGLGRPWPLPIQKRLPSPTSLWPWSLCGPPWRHPATAAEPPPSPVSI